VILPILNRGVSDDEQHKRVTVQYRFADASRSCDTSGWIWSQNSDFGPGNRGPDGDDHVDRLAGMGVVSSGTDAVQFALSLAQTAKTIFQATSFAPVPEISLTLEASLVAVPFLFYCVAIDLKSRFN
jgi:hypothetical protein